MNMDKLYSLKEKLMDELIELSEQGMSMSNLQAIDTISRTVKNIDKVIKCESSSGYSNDGEWSARGSYGGGSYGEMSYGRGYSRDNMNKGGHAYDHMNYSGRYSRNDPHEVVVENLQKMMDNARDQTERSTIMRMINDMNSMK